MEALVVVHVDPARDLAGAAMAAFAQAVLVQGADAHAGTEDGAKSRVHGQSIRARVVEDAGAQVCYLLLISLMSNTIAWAGPIGERGSLP